MAFIEINGLSKHYPSRAGAVAALDGIDLTIDEGTFLGVMGPSGSGKSTFLSLIGGLCHPTAGSIRVDGIDIFRLPAEQLADFRREYLGFVFQSFNLVPYLTALENVMLPLAVKKLSTAEKRERALQVLERVGLKARAGHLPGELSGGEQERVAIARALVNRPPVILADEPTAPLDSERAMAVIRILNRMARQFETAIIVVTHDEKIIPTFRRLYQIRDGRTHEQAGEGREV
ncbi:MAG TPA: ABC transporter ATP-binding protein [Desulfomicrobium sp.]|nr:ABC transporter ATP-binding protein [Desulfomicrobium sp.]